MGTFLAQASIAWEIKTSGDRITPTGTMAR